MSTKTELAEQYHARGYGCGQAVLAELPFGFDPAQFVDFWVKVSEGTAEKVIGHGRVS